MPYGTLALDAISTSGNLAITGNVTTTGNLTVTGNIAASGNLTTSRGTVTSLTSRTAQATTSGTSVQFTEIPNWVQRITMSLVGVSAAAGATILFRLGTSGTLVTTGYTMVVTSIQNAASPGLSGQTDAIGYIYLTAAASLTSGIVTFVKQSGNTWVATLSATRTGSETVLQLSTGSVTLAGVLDTVGIALSTSTFDAGSVNIMYE